VDSFINDTIIRQLVQAAAQSRKRETEDRLFMYRYAISKNITKIQNITINYNEQATC